MADNRSKAIQELNDRFRKGDISVPGIIVITRGVQALLEEEGKSRKTFEETVQNFDDFSEENDPHGEHDFGEFSFLNAVLYWKIDQYNTTYDGGSEDPTDLAKTCRVLTIMLTHEY